jgi:hypothetical protein
MNRWSVLVETNAVHLCRRTKTMTKHKTLDRPETYLLTAVEKSNHNVLLLPARSSRKARTLGRKRMGNVGPDQQWVLMTAVPARRSHTGHFACTSTSG